MRARCSRAYWLRPRTSRDISITREGVLEPGSRVPDE